jgi:hypothetical protein
MPTSASTLKFVRLTHRYLGVFIAPSLLFFALTGALQTLSLHEGSQGSSYKAPGWIATLAQIHKNQTDKIPVRKPKPDAAPGADKPRGDKPDAAKLPSGPPAAPPAAPTALPTGKWKMHWPMKAFFVLVALSLFLSTLSGIYMALKYGGSKVVVWALLLAGVVVPLVLLKF